MSRNLSIHTAYTKHFKCLFICIYHPQWALFLLLFTVSDSLIRTSSFASVTSHTVTYARTWLPLSLSLLDCQVMMEKMLRKARTLQLKKRRLKPRAAKQQMAADICGFVDLIPDCQACFNHWLWKKKDMAKACPSTIRKSSLWQPHCSPNFLKRSLLSLTAFPFDGYWKDTGRGAWWWRRQQPKPALFDCRRPERKETRGKEAIQGYWGGLKCLHRIIISSSLPLLLLDWDSSRGTGDSDWTPTLSLLFFFFSSISAHC